MTQLLYGYEAQLLNVTQIRLDMFNKLLNWLQKHGGFKDVKLLSVAKKLIIFLIIFCNNTLYKLLNKVT